MSILHVSRSGAGEPVLLLHGIGGSADSFGPQAGALGTRHLLLAWDAPGYARSADPGRAPGMSGYADAAASLLPGLGPVHVLGVSWGGVIATRLALEHPRLVRSLVLAGSTRGSGRTAAARAAMLARPADLARLGAAEFAARRGPRLVSPAAPPALVRRVVDTMASSVRLPGYRYAASSMAATAHDHALTTLALPVLVVAGRQDTVTGVAESAAIAAAVPGARLAVIEQAGHLANQEQPAEFNARVADFWKGLS